MKVETASHLFMRCEKTERVWFGSPLTICIPNNPNQHFSDWISNIISTKDESIIIQVAAITYSIWHVRNQAIYEDLLVPEAAIIQRALSSTSAYFQANKKLPKTGTSTTPAKSSSNHLRPASNPPIKRWIKPDRDFVKVNTDANLQVHGRWGLGCVIRDSEGQVKVAATWSRHGFEDVLTAEAFGLYAGVVLALCSGFHNVIFENDNKSVIEKIQRKGFEDRTYMGSIVSEIWTLIGQFVNCRFCFTHRQGNQVAHAMAQFAHSEPNKVWRESVPIPAQNVYIHDLIF